MKIMAMIMGRGVRHVWKTGVIVKVGHFIDAAKFRKLVVGFLGIRW